jgi:glycosyltransferase involved in cell wall biosynthesis
VLVAPLSHENCSIDEVRTVFSTKLLEYLISGRPILVFAPKDSYHAWSAEKNGWGYLVTKNSPKGLAEAIVKVVKDHNLAAELVQKALKEAHSRNARVYAESLKEWVTADASSSAVRSASGRRLPREAREA